jgi:hypothetical protein
MNKWFGLKKTFKNGWAGALIVGLLFFLFLAIQMLFPEFTNSYGMDWGHWLIVVPVGSILIFVGLFAGFYVINGESIVFKIKAGKHTSSPWKMRLKTRPFVEAAVELNKDMFYDSKAVFTNKLFGFSSGIHHLWRSARIGYTPISKSRVAIMAYIRERGQKITVPICQVPWTAKFYASIEEKNTGYGFKVKVGDETHSTLVTAGKKKRIYKGLRYCLWPYFGGTMRAPFTFTVKVTYLS